MLVTDDEALARRARHLSTQARLPGPAYDHDEVGYNYRLTNVAAAIGLAQLEQLDVLLAGRRANAAAYDAAIAALARACTRRRASRGPIRRSGSTARPWIPARRGSRRLIARLAAAGIEARPIWTPLHRTGLYRDAPQDRRRGRRGRIFDTGFSLPSSSNLSDEARGRVIDALGAAIAEASVATEPARG